MQRAALALAATVAMAMAMAMAMAFLAACSSTTGAQADAPETPATALTPVTASPPPTPQARCPVAVARSYQQVAGNVTFSTQVDGAADLVVCDFRNARASGGCSGATVTINTEPQAFRDFQRWVVETTQNSSAFPAGSGMSPSVVKGVGVEADWLAGRQVFQASTDRRWVTVALKCTGTQASYLAHARTLAVSALAAGI